MNLTDLSAHIKRELETSFGYTSGELATQRAKAMTYFMGEPRGDEVEGRSKLISTDLADVVDWVLPKIVRAFGSGDEAAKFIAYGAEDEEQAEIEGEYCNYVLFRDQSGFITFYQWFQDALLQKTGYVKVYWDDTPVKERKEFTGLTKEERDAVAAGGKVLEETKIEVDVDVGLNASSTETVYDLTVEVITEPGRLVVEALPPEEVRVNTDHTQVSLKNARFVAHEREVTVSELIGMGIPRDVAEDLPGGTSIWDEEKEARYNLYEEREGNDPPSDPSLRKVNYAECYPLVDFDGDGQAERRKVIYAGDEILDNEETRRVCIVALSPFPLSHKHHGRSFYDKVKEIQDNKTALIRQIMDNLYLINNSRHAVVQGEVNLQDLLNSRPGGIVRQRRPGMIEPLKTPPVGQDAYQFLEYLDKIREERAGVGPETYTGMGQLAQQTAWGIERLMSAKEELIGLVIAVFRETGVNELFENIHSILRENQTWESPTKLGKWQNVNPSTWRSRKVESSAVWTGLGEKIQRQRTLGTLVQMHNQIQMSPNGWMITPPQTFELYSDFCKASGVTETYLVDPRSPQGQQLFQQHMQAQQQAAQAPNPDMMKAQADMERVNIEKQRLGIDMQKAKLDAQVKMTGAASKEREAQIKARMEGQKSQVMLRRQEVDEQSQIMGAYTEERAQRADEELRRQELALNAHHEGMKRMMEQYKAELDSVTKLLLAAAQEQTKRDSEANEMKAELEQLRRRLGGDDGK